MIRDSLNPPPDADGGGRFRRRDLPRKFDTMTDPDKCQGWDDLGAPNTAPFMEMLDRLHLEMTLATGIPKEGYGTFSE